MERWENPIELEEEDPEDGEEFEETDLTFEESEKNVNAIRWPELEDEEPEPDPGALEELDDLVWQAMKNLNSDTSAPSSY